MLSHDLEYLENELERSLLFYTMEPFKKAYTREEIDKVWKIRVMMEEVRKELETTYKINEE